MQNVNGYMCDGCGFAREKPGQCPFCQAPLSVYSKVQEKEYEVEMEEQVPVKQGYKWYESVNN